MTRTAAGLTLVGASAGSGKTHRITTVVGDAVDPEAPDAISPEQLVAVTYTRRASGELSSRIRKKLVAQGAYEKAHLLPLAYLGTVHSVCLRLVQEFALDAGLSPKVDVLSGDEQRWLREALEWGLPLALRERIEDLAQRMELRWDHQRGRFDWLTPVQDIMTLARSNRIESDRLPAMAERSVEGLLALLPPPAHDGASLDRALLAALENASSALAAIDDGTKKTGEVRNTIADLLAAAKNGRLPWPRWARLMKLDPAKQVRPVIAPLVDAAIAAERHPALHDDLRDLTHSLFEAARLGLDAYAEWKEHRRVVDYVDMIDRALSLLTHQPIADELQRRLRLLVVDEMQDTSPIQLALFTGLHRLIGRSTWVGDRKQCIFEFAGADPTLMEAVATWAARDGGTTQQLEGNWRSRTELVDACSHLFAAAFARHGLEPADVVVGAKREVRRTDLPVFGVWSLFASNTEEEAAALATGIHRMLANPGDTPIEDRATGEVRPVRAGDIAVLVATNAEAQRMSTALARRGISATVSRAGLMSTPEGTMVRAALGVIHDTHDSLSPAVIDAMLGFGEGGPDAWLTQTLTNQGAEPSRVHARLSVLRLDLESCSPSETLDRVMLAIDLVAICRRWPDAEQRMANIDALRALTAKYEEQCVRLHEAATVAGLIRFLDEASERVRVRDEERASDEQHVSSDAQAVTIATYHRAKGLEWPVVVLGSLDRGTRRTVFDVSPETDRAAFDPSEPLGGRWIRYWPSPFGSHSRLGDAAKRSPTGLAIEEREARERTRLLYVGFTRARDHLVLAARPRGTSMKAQWLDELCDSAGPLIELPHSDDGEGHAEVSIRGCGGATLRVAARRWVLQADAQSAPSSEEPPRTWFATVSGSDQPVVPYWVSPSSAATDESARTGASVLETVRIGERLPLGRARDVGWNVVGDVLHAFLAADESSLDDAQRRGRAQRVLRASDARRVLSEEALLVAGDRLRAWVARCWPGARWHRELPVDAVLDSAAGVQRVRGTIDLLLETTEGLVIIDHKSFPGPSEHWPEKAREYAPQVSAYARVLEQAGRRVLGTWIHFSVGGGAVRIDASSALGHP